MLKPSVLQSIEIILDNDYDLRRNTITTQIEEYSKTQKRFIPLDDNRFNTIYTSMIKNGIECSFQDLFRIIHSEAVKQIDPFKDYLENLEPWDQQQDYILTLANTVATKNQKFWQKCFKKWFVALIAGMYINKPNHTVLLFSGKQGIGKTTWQRRVIPSFLGNYVFDGKFNPDNKDHKIKLSECLLIVLDELGVCNRKVSVL